MSKYSAEGAHRRVCRDDRPRPLGHVPKLPHSDDELIVSEFGSEGERFVWTKREAIAILGLIEERDPMYRAHLKAAIEMAGVGLQRKQSVFDSRDEDADDSDVRDATRLPPWRASGKRREG